MKIRKKLLAGLAVLTCSVVGLGFGVNAASAFGKLEVETEDRTYYGEVVTLDNLSDFSGKEISLSKCDINTPIIEFAFMPSEQGTAASYTPDFEQMSLSFYNPADATKNMSVSIEPHYKRNPGAVGSGDEYFISILAKAGNTQSYYAEWVGGQAKNKDVMHQRWSGNFAQQFDGYMRHNGYVDEYGNAIPKGDNRPVRLYYDATENALFTDIGEMNENRMFTYTDKGVTKYRWRIRDFDKTDYKKYDGDNDPDNNPQFGESVWGGFTQSETLKMDISFGNIVEGKEPSILLSKVAGNPVLESPIVVSTPSKGETNIAYEIPKPIFYDESAYKERDFISVSGEYKIEKKSGDSYQTVCDYTAYTNGASFTPTQAGDYLISYKAQGNTKSITVSVVEDLAGTEIIPNIIAERCYINATLDLGVSCVNTSQVEKPSVKLELFRDGLLVNEWTVGDSYEYKFTENGLYTLVYTSVDYLGRTTRQEHSLDVLRYYVSWADGISETIAVPFGTIVQTPSVTDVEIFDVLFDADVVVQSCAITVSYNGASYKPLAETKFDKQGEYFIQYQIKYDAYKEETVNAVRKIFIYNQGLEKIEVEGLPFGTKLDRAPENDVEMKLRALKGEKIAVPYNYFGNITSVTLTAPDGAVTDCTDALKKGSFEFTPQSTGVYELFAVHENEYFRVVKALNIEVRNSWVTFSNVDDLTLNLGANVHDYAPTCKDFYGNEVADYKTEIYYMGQKVENATGSLEKLGVYTISYIYEKNGEKISAERMVQTIDVLEPTLKLQDAQTKVNRGAKVQLATYECVDDSGLVPKVVVSVTLNGKEIGVYNNSFDATEEGEYVVTYYAIDAQGNSTTAQYTVLVENNTMLFVVGGVAIGVALLAIGVAIFIRKKKIK